MHIMAISIPKKWLVCLIILGCILFIFITQSAIDKFALQSHQNQDNPFDLTDVLLQETWTNDQNFLIETSGCRIKNLDAFGNESRKLWKKEKPYKCKDNKNIESGLVYLNEKKLYINTTIRTKVLKHYNATEKDFYCCVSYFKRYADEENDSGFRSLNSCDKFNDVIGIKDEYMSISCYHPIAKPDGKPIYQNFDFAILRKSHVEARCLAQEKADEANGINCPDRLSVLILGIDSVSRLQTQRQLNNTREKLKDMGAIEFVGYNRVGDNTFPNFGAALMTGENQDFLTKNCIDKKKFVDKCTFLWDYFQETGYRTAFVENMHASALYTYTRNGFHRQPADYYGRTFFNGMTKIYSKEPNCFRVGKSVSDDEAVVQWAVEFQKEFSKEPHFGFFYTNMFSHDYMNTLQQVDEFLPTQLQILAENGGQFLKKTLLVLVGDHGLRFGGLLETEVGRYEINLPMLFLVFPQWFRDKYPEAIEQVTENARKRLTTLFDLHSTLRDIANCRAPFTKIGLEKKTASKSQKGISFFRPIPENRTCSDAGIPEKYCACHKSEVKRSTTNDKAQLLGKLVVDRLNNVTANLRHLCAKLNLWSVDHVKSYASTSASKTNEHTTYVVGLTTSPGNGNFEAILTYNERDKAYNVEKELTRLNKYGNDSSCIKNYGNSRQLLICHCVK